MRAQAQPACGRERSARGFEGACVRVGRKKRGREKGEEVVARERESEKNGAKKENCKKDTRRRREKAYSENAEAMSQQMRGSKEQ
eukprot:4478569-Pleurochrysis_carterae.AAC.7